MNHSELQALMAKNGMQGYEITHPSHDTVVLCTSHRLPEQDEATIRSCWPGYEVIFQWHDDKGGISETGARKDDGDKVRLDLLSAQWVIGVGKVLTFGGRRYGAHNWRKGLERSRLLGACLRHVFAYLGGEDLDPDTGLLHLFHASCCLMFASELHFTHPHLDDRYTSSKAAPPVGKHPFPVEKMIYGDWLDIELEDGRVVRSFVPKSSISLPDAGVKGTLALLPEWEMK